MPKPSQSATVAAFTHHMASLLPSTSLRLSCQLHHRHQTLTLTLISKSPLRSAFTTSTLPRPFPITFHRLPRSNLSPPPASSSSSSSSQPQTLEENPTDPSLLPPPLREIVSLFQSVEDPKAKYHQLLHYASLLPALHQHHKTDSNRVRGCVSQVWVRAFPDPNDPSLVSFEADSDSALTKGLAALLVRGLSGSPPEAISRVPPTFVHLLGLKQSLTPSRNNGFLNMLKLMQKKASEVAGDAKDPTFEEKDPILDGKDRAGVVEVEELERGERFGLNGSGGLVEEEVMEGKGADLEEDGGLTSGYEDRSGGSGRRADRIRRKLKEELRPVELELEDISYQHAGHAGVKGISGGETHFNLRVVSKEFEGRSLVKRHRLVYDLLQEELRTGLHALSIVAKTPSEV